MTGDFRQSGSPDGVFDLLGEKIQCIVIDLPPLARAPNPSDHFLPAERFSHATAFHNRKDGRLDCRKSPTTLRTRTTAANRLTLIGLPGVDHP